MNNKSYKDDPNYSLTGSGKNRRWRRNPFSFMKKNDRNKDAIQEEIQSEYSQKDRKRRKRAGRAVFLGATAIMASTVTGCTADAAMCGNPSMDSMAQECRETLAKNDINFSTDVYNNEALITLEKTDTIILDKDFVNIGDRWDVSVDGKDIIEINGEMLTQLGDNYVYKDKQGNFLGAQSEDKINIRKTTHLHDTEGNYSGTITKKLVSLLDIYTLNDKDGNEQAKLEQNLDINFTGEIKNNAGEVEYTFDKQILSLGANITIKKKTDNPTIDEMDAIKLITTANEIQEGKSNGSGSKHKNDN